MPCPENSPLKLDLLCPGCSGEVSCIVAWVHSCFGESVISGLICLIRTVIKDKIIIVNGLDKETVHKIIKACESIENIVVLLCGINGAYHMPCEEKFLEEIDKYYIQKHSGKEFNI